MDFNLIPGTEGEQKMTVTSTDTAIHFGSGLIGVFATPAMIALMEKTAQLSVQEFLPQGFITLGTEISVTHEKATLVGKHVRCESVLVEVSGKRLLFRVTVYDEKGLIGRGTHRRYIVEAVRFMQKLVEIS